MAGSDRLGHDRAVTPVIGVVLIVAITIILGTVVGVYGLGIGEEIREKPTFAALEVTFEEEPASEPQYEKFRWEVELTNNGGDTVPADEVVVHLDHGNQRVSGTLNSSLGAGETVDLMLVHNNQGGDTIPPDVTCTDVNVACRLAGDDGNYPDVDQVQLQLVHQPSGSILQREQIDISGEYGIYNENLSGIAATNQTLTFA